MNSSIFVDGRQELKEDLRVLTKFLRNSLSRVHAKILSMKLFALDLF